MLKIEINVENSKWKKDIPSFKENIEQVVKQTFKNVLKTSNPNLELSILLTSDKEIRKLNKLHRKKNKKTNVLAFPMNSKKSNDEMLLGDIAVSLETIIDEAKKFDISKRMYLSKMIIHGLLHLLGYDHIKNSDFLIMNKIEKEIFNKIT